MSNMSIASSDGILPKVSVANVRANFEENMLITSGMICKIPIAITILKIVFIFIIVFMSQFGRTIAEELKKDF